MLQSFITLLLASSLLVSASPHSRQHHAINRKRASNTAPASLNGTVPHIRKRAGKRCAKKSSSLPLSASSTIAATTTSHAAHSAIAGVQAKPTVVAEPSSSAAPAAPPKSSPAASPTVPDNGNAVGAPVKPDNWPTKTQAAATYSATAATASDPMLLGISYALNNENNPLFTQTHTGDLTYYGQGLGACGDTYDDSTFTAAVAHELYDSWPGSTAETNRSPICGPYVPGRLTMNAVTGLFGTSLKSSVGAIMIGGDGLPNCNPAAGQQCHIPLTATIHNPATGKSVVVKIVDRCEGCQIGDIDVTPAVFKTIADPALGRVSGITWKFNKI